MSKDELLDALKELLPAQFGELVYRYDLPPAYLSSNSSQAEQAITLLRYAERQDPDYQKLNRLLQKIDGFSAEQVQLNQDTRAVLERELSHNATRQAVNPRHSSMLRNSANVRLFTELEQRLQASEAAQQDPILLNGMGKFANAVGEVKRAGEFFACAAELEDDREREAENHYNAYRAALEERAWDKALAALLQAAELAPEHYEPFPLRKYEPVRILGAGGFGTAFLCKGLFLDGEWVIKTLHAPELLSRSSQEIFQEARLLSALHHPGIIGIEDCDFADAEGTRPYLVMEYFPASALADYLAERPLLTPAEARALALRIAEAMQAAHEQNILHRDLKPANLLLRREGDDWQIKLIDFGLALRQETVRETVAGRAGGSTLGNSAAGTYQFSSPEQFGLRSEPCAPYSDVFSFGKTLCFALFKQPNLALSDGKALEAQGEGAFAELLDRCINNDPARRPQSFQEVVDTLRGIASANEQAPSTPASPVEKPSRKAGYIVLLLLIVGVTLLLNQYWPVFNLDTFLVPPSEQTGSSSPSQTPPVKPPAPEVKTVALSLNANVPGGQVEINGENHGATPVEVQLPPGAYRIKVSKDGYSAFERELNLSEDTSLQAELKAKTATLGIHSNVSGNRVEINGENYGATPVTAQLPLGDYRIKISKDGYTAFERELNLSKDTSLNAELKAKTAELSLNSNLSGDRVEINGGNFGATPVKIQLPLGEYQIKISKDGYTPFERQLNLSKDTHLQAELKAKTAELSLNSNLSGDRVEINGQNYGATPVKTQLPLGEYRIKISKDGYTPFERELNLTKDTSLQAELKVKLATLNLNSNVSGDRAEINGRNYGATPVRVQLPLGTYRIKISKPGYSHFEQELRLTEDQNLQVELKVKTFTLSLNSNVSGDRVEINGKNYGATPVREQLPPGDYRIKISKDGYTDFERQVNLSEDLRIQAELKPHLAKLTVRSNVYGDQVEIDGRKYGPTPVEVELPAGSYNIKVSKPGYIDYAGELRLYGDFTLKAELKAQAQPRRQASSPPPPREWAPPPPEMQGQAGDDPQLKAFMEMLRRQHGEGMPDIPLEEMFPASGGVATLSVRSNLQGGRLEVNGKNYGSPPLDIQLKTGTYQIKLTKSGNTLYFNPNFPLLGNSTLTIKVESR